MSATWLIAASAGVSTEDGISRSRHRVRRGTAAAIARRMVALSWRKPAPLTGWAA